MRVSYPMLRAIGNFGMKYEKYEAAGTMLLRRQCIVSPFVTQVKTFTSLSF